MQGRRVILHLSLTSDAAYFVFFFSYIFFISFVLFHLFHICFLFKRKLWYYSKLIILYEWSNVLCSNTGMRCSFYIYFLPISLNALEQSIDMEAFIDHFASSTMAGYNCIFHFNTGTLILFFGFGRVSN